MVLSGASSPAEAQRSKTSLEGPVHAPPHWQAGNPGGGGAFAHIAVGPTGVLLAASDLGGAYLSQDHGQSWSTLGPASGLDQTHVSCAAMHPSSPQIYLVGTEAGVYSTADSGAHFQHTLTTGYIEALAFAPSDPQRVFASWHSAWDLADGAVMRSDDGGGTWQQISTNLPAGLRLLHLVVGADDPDLVFALSGAGRFAQGPAQLFRSTDGGITWSASVLPSRTIDVARDPHDPARFFATVDGLSPNQPGELLVSSDRGLSWAHVADHGGIVWPDSQAPGHLRMFDPRHQFTWDAAQGFFDSTDGGASWTQLPGIATWKGGWSPSPFAWTEGFDGPRKSVAFDPTDPNHLVWVNSQFVYGTFDGGHHAEQLFTDEMAPGAWRSRGFDNVVPATLAVNETNASEVFAGYFDLGLWRSLDGGESWRSCNQPALTGGWNGAGGNTMSVICDPVVPGRVWATMAAEIGDPAHLITSADHGTTWQVVGAGLPFVPLGSLALDPSSPSSSRVLFVSAAAKLYRSSDGGQSWQLVLGGAPITTVTVDPTRPTVVLAGGRSGLWRSDQAGQAGTWQAFGPTAFAGSGPVDPWDDSFDGVAAIAASPTLPGHLFVAVRGTGLYSSLDDGATWHQDLANPHLFALAMSPAQPGLVYLTSSSAGLAGGLAPSSLGVLRSLDGGKTWTSFSPALAFPMASALALSATDPKRVFVASPGAGVLRLTD